jgi:hypothetical protein
LSIEEIALGFVHVANESMSRPIRALTEVSELEFFCNRKYSWRLVFREKVLTFVIMFWHVLVVLVVNMLVQYVRIFIAL